MEGTDSMKRKRDLLEDEEKVQEIHSQPVKVARRCTVAGCDGSGHVNKTDKYHNCEKFCPLREERQVEISKSGSTTGRVGREKSGGGTDQTNVQKVRPGIQRQNTPFQLVKVKTEPLDVDSYGNQSYPQTTSLPTMKTELGLVDDQFKEEDIDIEDDDKTNDSDISFDSDSSLSLEGIINKTHTSTSSKLATNKRKQQRKSNDPKIVVKQELNDSDDEEAGEYMVLAEWTDGKLQELGSDQPTETEAETTNKRSKDCHFDVSVIEDPDDAAVAVKENTANYSGVEVIEDDEGGDYAPCYSDDKINNDEDNTADDFTPIEVKVEVFSCSDEGPSDDELVKPSGDNPADVKKLVKWKRKAYSIADKLQLVDRVRSGESPSSVMKDVGIPGGTLRSWLKDEEKLRGISAAFDESGLKTTRARHRKAKDRRLDEAVYKWYKRARAMGKSVSGSIIQQQAMRMKLKMDPLDNSFAASSGWLRGFKGRYGIKWDKEAVSPYPDTMSKIFKKGQYSSSQLYNCGEIALFYKLLPDKTLSTANDMAKTQKHRLTSLFCCNQSGSHKLVPLIIGKLEEPHCFHHVNMKTLPAVYKSSSNALMTATIFKDWFHSSFVPEVRQQLLRQKLEPKALLLIDKCSGHPGTLVSDDKKIRVTFLPRDTQIQPLDGGIMATIKRNYRRHLINSKVESNLNIKDFLKQLNIKEAMHLLCSAWGDVSPRYISSCWEKVIYSPNDVEHDNDFEEFDQDNLCPAERHCEGCDAKDIVAVKQATGQHLDEKDIEAWFIADDGVPTIESNKEIINTKLYQPGENGDFDSDVEEIEALPEMSVVVNSLEVGLKWLESCKSATSVQVTQLRNIIRLAKEDARNSCKQMMTDK